MFEVRQPYFQIVDLTGAPVSNGSLYFGVSGLDPRYNQVTIYWDSAGTTVASQPIKLLNGYPTRDGTPAALYTTSATYAVAAYDKQGRKIFYKDSVEFNGPLATTTSDGWMAAADKIALAGKLDRATAFADMHLGTAALLDASAAGIPTGCVLPFAGASVPSGWITCSGQLISRTGYQALFTAIGTLYGAGDGYSTFGVPDLRGEFIRGWDNARGVDGYRVLGSFQTDQVQDHDHTFPALKSGIVSGGSPNNATPSQSGQFSDITLHTSVQPSGYHGAETRPRNIAMLYCIKI